MITLLRKSAALSAALLLASCAAKKESVPPENPNDAPALTANFVDGPAPSEKKPLIAGIGSFFFQLLPRKSPPAPVASPVNWAGEIRMVNIAENFVLVESNSPVATIPGEKYLVIQNGIETGAVRMSSLRNPPFLIADIVSGDPSPGDKIYLPQPSVSVPTADTHPAPKPSFFQKWLREILPSSKIKE